MQTRVMMAMLMKKKAVDKNGKDLGSIYSNYNVVNGQLILNKEGVITNDPKINDLAWREPRKGWGPMEMNV